LARRSFGRAPTINIRRFVSAAAQIQARMPRGIVRQSEPARGNPGMSLAVRPSRTLAMKQASGQSFEERAARHTINQEQ
jgi:hypothetical protein